MQRAEVLLEFAQMYEELIEQVMFQLDDPDLNISPTDRDLVEVLLQNKEFDPSQDMEQVLGLLERLELSTKSSKLAFDDFKQCMDSANDAISDCPFEEAALMPSGITGVGPNGEEVRIKFEESDMQISVDPPHFEDESEDEVEEARLMLHKEIEEWLLAGL